MAEKKYIALNLAKAQFTGNFVDAYPPSLIKALLDTVPAADVEPVRRGHWRISKNGVLPTNKFVCSECNGLVIVSTYRNRCLYNFCPNCGAKMKGEENGK